MFPDEKRLLNYAKWRHWQRNVWLFRGVLLVINTRQPVSFKNYVTLKGIIFKFIYRKQVNSFYLDTNEHKQHRSSIIKVLKFRTFCYIVTTSNCFVSETIATLLSHVTHPDAKTCLINLLFKTCLSKLFRFLRARLMVDQKYRLLCVNLLNRLKQLYILTCFNWFVITQVKIET